MTEAFLTLNPRERSDILGTAAARSGTQALILEKDIWLCWVLETLFSIPDHHPMAFKGGTSLSKVYGIIDRFSEDVDITLDYRAFHDDLDPFASGVSKTAIRRFSARLRSSVAGHIGEVVAPALRAAADGFEHATSYEVRIGEDGETIRFVYPSAVEESIDYLKSEVLLEFGGRNIIDPHEQHEIVPYMANLVPGPDYPVAIVTVLSPTRTFWEKATLIHVECHRRRLANRGERLSRHWYDLSCLAGHDTGQAALSDRALLEDVVRHKKIFFNSRYANYDQCLAGKLRLVPDADQLPALRSDYDAMRTVGIVRQDAPNFDSLIERIRDVEADANGSR